MLQSLKMLEKIAKYSIYLQKQFNTFKTKTDREAEIIDSMLHKLKKKEVVIYLLIIDNFMVGFVALSVNKLISKVFEVPAVEIEYLFVDKDFRGEIIKSLNQKASEYLIYQTKIISKQIQENVGVRSIILYPDMQNKKLIDFYVKIGFHKEKIITYKNNKKEFEYWLITKI